MTEKPQSKLGKAPTVASRLGIIIHDGGERTQLGSPRLAWALEKMVACVALEEGTF